MNSSHASGSLNRLAASATLLMELVDNVVMLAIPGAMQASLASPLFWISMAAALGIAGLAAYPLNRWLIARGQGHAVVHAGHTHADHAHTGHGHGTQASSREPR